MTTTLNAIKSAIETTIVGLTPAGAAWTQRKYMRAADTVAWEDRALSDVDRRFSVRVSPDGGITSFGVLTEHSANATLIVTIGHQKGQQLQDGEERKDTDCRQIVLELTDPANRPTGVWRIALLPPVSTIDREQWWQTEIKYLLIFAEANP